MTKNKNHTDSIDINLKHNIKELVNKITNKEISISDLTNIEKQEVYLFLKKCIIEKNIKIRKNKKRILQNEINNYGNMDSILSKLSPIEQEDFLKYLNT